MNDSLLPNNMTKSYLLESDPYLKTSTKASPFALNTEEGIFRSSHDWNNVPSNVPPIAYINGNSVRAIRCRHYSQQQSNTESEKNQINLRHKITVALEAINLDSEDEEEIVVKQQQAVDYNGKEDKSVTVADANADANADAVVVVDADAASASSNMVANSDVSPAVVSQASSQYQSTPGKQQQPVIKSPSQSATSIRDYVTNDENLYNSDHSLLTERLEKGIQNALRSAKEGRLGCNELLIPQQLLTHISSEVSEMADSEPCGLRGCVMKICIDDSFATGHSHSRAGKSTADHSHQRSFDPFDSCRLLGEVALDPSLVPTFNVFVYLRRERVGWLEMLENMILGKERIVLSEIYLIEKRKLYQSS